MATFNAKIGTGEVPIPPEYADEIIKEMTKESAVLTHGKAVTMSSKEYKQPVLSVLPQAYFVADGGLVETTKAAWENLTITAEEIAVIIPVPKNLLNDTDIDIYSEVTPLIAEAMGRVVDSAVLFGVQKPTTWGEAVVPRAKAVKNVIKLSANKDLTKAVPELAGKISKQGYSVNGFISPVGAGWELVSMRDTQGRPIYVQDLQNDKAGKLYGFPLNELENGAFDPTDTSLIALDWQKFLVGIRRDMTIEFSDQATITDQNGKVVYNLFQQNATAMKVTMRIGYQVVNPVTALQPDKNKRFPAGVVVPATSAALEA